MRKCVNTFVFLFLSLGLAGGSAFAQQPIPEAAQTHFRSGVSLIEQAQTPEDLRNARAEFETAAELAPDWPDIHFNLAQLAAETDKPVKAIKEYETYLDLMPAAADRDQVEIEIVRLQGLLDTKRKVGLPGVTFAAMPDGIWVMQIAPGSRAGGHGFLRQGMKIVAVEDTPVTGVSLGAFFRAIDKATGEGGSMSVSSKDRMFSRFSRPKETAGAPQETGPVFEMKIKTPGHDNVGTLLFKKSMFHSKVIEIEEDEFEQEVLSANQPVVVTFWAEGCDPCQEFVADVERESARPGQQVKFVNVNLDDNKKLGEQLAVTGLPTLMVFKAGQMVSVETGQLSGDKVEKMVRNALQGN